MDKYETIFTAFIIFIVISLGDYILFKRRYLRKIKKNKKGKKKNNELMEISYLVNKFNLDKDKLPLNHLLIISSIINGFIISLVSVTIMLINTFMILRFAIGFVLLMTLIYSIYEIMGRHYVKKGMTNNGNKKSRK